MAQVFISHAHEDRAHAQALASWLNEEGWNVWWDTEIRAGSAYRAIIERELDGADCVVVLWSSASVKSHWVADEAQSAAERNVLLPVLIDNTAIPLGFRQIQAVQMPHLFESDTPEMGELSKSLASLIGLPTREPRTEQVVSTSERPRRSKPRKSVKAVAPQALTQDSASDTVSPTAAIDLGASRDRSEWPRSLRGKKAAIAVILIMLLALGTFGGLGMWVASRFTENGSLQSMAATVAGILGVLLTRATFPWLRTLPPD